MDASQPKQIKDGQPTEKSRIRDTLRFYGKVLKESVTKFFKDDVLTQSAALAFYMIFSLPSILLIILWIAARFYKEASVQEAIFLEIGDLVGHEGARQLIATVGRIDIQEPSWWATAMGIGVLLFTATTVLVTAQSALNRIFEVESTDAASSGIWELLRDRVVSFTLLVSIAFILTVALMLDALIAAFGRFVAKWIGVMSNYVMVFDAILLDVGATALLFAIFFKYLPDFRLKWKDTWFGALTTAGLFTAGKHLIGFFIGNSEVADLYDAAGSVLVFMLWVYYASAIFFFGAIITFVRANPHRNKVAGGKQLNAQNRGVGKDHE
jgi:membrane protein